jgi:hypothetical protein
MIRDELFARWRYRLDDYTRTHALVSGEVIVNDVLRDLNAILSAEAEELLTLKAAADLSGYSTGHLSRLIRTGKLPNAGRPNAPLIRRADLPRKATALPNGDEGTKLLTKAQIARSIVHPHRSNDG